MTSIFKGYSFHKNLANVSMVTGLVAEGETLTLNGKPLRILSGAIHYFRVVPAYWRDRLLKLKACGLNTVETYVPWNLHEPLPGVFRFDGILDVRQFLEIAQELDLLVIFRPGPYICAEWEFGGLPSWLLHDTNMAIRSTYPPYLEAMERFLTALLSVIADLQFTKNGSIIMVQVENEYGAYGNDRAFMDANSRLLRKHGIVEMLVTSDGDRDLVSGQATKVWMTVNDQHQLNDKLDKLAALQPARPLMVMEYWSGWFDHWTESHHSIPVEQYATELSAILSRNSSVNIFMFHGGTNFGFMNGANNALSSQLPYEPTVTSYDYDALVSESGELTTKWHRTKELLGEFGLLAHDLPSPPPTILAKTYGSCAVSGWMPFKELLKEFPNLEVKTPLPMELLNYKKGFGQSYGYILYEKEIPNLDSQLILGAIHDRAIILVDDEEIALVEYTASLKTSHLVQVRRIENDSKTIRLGILVENMGRLNFIRSPKTLNDQRKGMIGSVELNGQLVTNWTVRPLEFTEGEVKSLSERSSGWKADMLLLHELPGLFRVNLDIEEEVAHDTFLDMTGWGRGVVFVNGFNVGRYWPRAGPQRTLYIPGPLLKKGANMILVFELHTSMLTVQSTSAHLLG